MANTRLETALSTSYLPHWGHVEVAKEFIQNMVYAQTILGDTSKMIFEGEMAQIVNSPSGFTKGKLLIGESAQRGVDGAPGTFGEGIDMALCVGVREGLDIKIQTNGFSVIPAIEPSSIDPSVEVLVLYIEETHKHEGTKVMIKGISQDDFSIAADSFAVLSGVDPETVKHNSKLDSDVGKNPIYVNGVRVVEMSSIYGYNFTNRDLMNRDRTSVDMDLLKKEVAYTLAKITEVSEAEHIIRNVVKDSNLLESQSGVHEFSANVDVWKQAVKNIYGNKVAIATGQEVDTEARYRRFNLITDLPYSWKWFFTYKLDIRETTELSLMADSRKNTHVKPAPEETTNLGWAKRLIKLYYGDYGTVKVSKKVYDAFGNDVQGLYDRESDVIWIRKDVLSTKEGAFKVLLHETVHRITGANDNTPEFTRGFEDAAWCILMRGKIDK